ncbi:MAG: trypsin-like peptidase domain-containing protein [Pseudomonadota bacterium]
MIDTLKFAAWPAIAGLLAALLILDRWVLPAGQAGGGASPTADISYARAVNSASPSVVNIYTAKLVRARAPNPLRDMFQRRLPPQQRQRIENSLGSGVIMTGAGHILTNNHVIAGADAIQVLLQDGRSARASVIGTDAATDLAVLKVELDDLSPVQTADSDAVRVGDVVLAIGNPLGFGNSVTQGIVSALGRYGLQTDTYENYIQTDAIIHQGNSGGALIDTGGRLVGINTLIFTGAQGNRAATGIGISLAIPVNLALFVMDDLIKYGEVNRGYIGVGVVPVLTRSNAYVLRVTDVVEGGPAARAGMQPGDVITHVDNEQVRDGSRTLHRIALLRPGEKVNVTVARGEESLDLEVIVRVPQQQTGTELR